MNGIWRAELYWSAILCKLSLRASCNWLIIVEADEEWIKCWLTRLEDRKEMENACVEEWELSALNWSGCISRLFKPRVLAILLLCYLDWFHFKLLQLLREPKSCIILQPWRSSQIWWMRSIPLGLRLWKLDKCCLIDPTKQRKNHIVQHQSESVLDTYHIAIAIPYNSSAYPRTSRKRKLTSAHKTPFGRSLLPPSGLSIILSSHNHVVFPLCNGPSCAVPVDVGFREARVAHGARLLGLGRMWPFWCRSMEILYVGNEGWWLSQDNEVLWLVYQISALHEMK